MADLTNAVSDTLSDVVPDPEEPTYPDGVVGDLMRQLDDRKAQIAQKRGMAQMFTDQADALEAGCTQLQSAIDALTPTAE